MALTALKRDSGKRISDSIITGLTGSATAGGRPNRLYSYTKGTNGRFGNVPSFPIHGPNAVYGFHRRILTFEDGQRGTKTDMLNKGLKGGMSSPVLEFALGTVVGTVSGGMGLIFSLVGLGASQISQRQVKNMLARPGDEVWQIEQTGKIGQDDCHVSGFFLFDPYRHKRFSKANAFMFHERRLRLDV